MELEQWRGKKSSFGFVEWLLCLIQLFCTELNLLGHCHCLASSKTLTVKKMVINLVLCYVMLPHFMSKIWCSQWAKSYALLCCVMICYADLFYEQNLKLSMSKILWSVMLPLLRDYDWNICEQTLCNVMNSYLMSKILLDLMKLTVSYCNQE